VYDLIGLREWSQNLRADLVVSPLLWRMERKIWHERWLVLIFFSIIIKGTSKKLWPHAFSITQAIGVKNLHG
jgi:hypothetical protein